VIRPVAKDGGGGTGHAPPHQIRVPRQLISFEIIFQFLFCIFFYLSNIAETGMVVTSIGLTVIMSATLTLTDSLIATSPVFDRPGESPVFYLVFLSTSLK